MQSLFIFIGIILFFIAALTISDHIQRKKGNTTERETPPPAINLQREGCCGLHEVCEKENLLAALTEKPDYFDDEELDRFAHRESEAYSEAEAEQFREVFYSILDHEKLRWIKSLQMRDISLPDQIKDEVLMVVNEHA